MDHQHVNFVEDASIIKAGGDGFVTSTPEKENMTRSGDSDDIIDAQNTSDIGMVAQSLDDDDNMVVHKVNFFDDVPKMNEVGMMNDKLDAKVNWHDVKDSPETCSNNRPDVETQTKRSCDKEGHICFDCFPIPDALLNQLHKQTGMSKLSCLQTIQTVVKFYKQDLVCSKYFACEASDDSCSEYSHPEGEPKNVEDSTLLFKATPKPLRRQRLREPEIAYDKAIENNQANFKPASRKEHSVRMSFKPELDFQTIPVSAEPTLKLCSADSFRKLARRLKLQSSGRDWIDPRNVVYVSNLFRKLNKVVARLDKPVLKKVIKEDDFDFIDIVVNLLRKEKRWSIQWEIFGILGTIAARDSKTRKCLLNSDFPAYLSRVILGQDVTSHHLGAFAELLTVLFTGGKPLPVYLMEHLGLDFVISILDIIEYDESRPGWAIPDVLVKLLLAYNLQFDTCDVYNNVTVHAISRMKSCKTLINRLIEWLDQKDSSLSNSWEVSVSVHQCVIKMITEIFLCRTTSHAFSVTQSVSLMKSLVKNLNNFSAGDNRRTALLKLIQTILRHCKYDYIRNTPCLGTLESILCEESELSYQDHGLIRSIFKEFPQQIIM